MKKAPLGRPGWSIINGALLIAALAISLTGASQVTAQQVVESCYVSVPKLGIPLTPPQRDLSVLIDRTVVFDANLQNDLRQEIEAFLQAGDRITLSTFSSYGQGDYTRAVLDGRLDVPLSDDQRFVTGKFILEKFDRCVRLQRITLRESIEQAIRVAMGSTNPHLNRTDIVATLNQFSPRFAQTPHSRHYLIIASDMLENSDLVSFYHRGGLRQLDPAAELNRIRRAGYLSNLAGAAVYAEGPAISLDNGEVGDRSFASLREFWRQYFIASNAHLADFGSPLLHGPIR